MPESGRQRKTKFESPPTPNTTSRAPPGSREEGTGSPAGAGGRKDGPGEGEGRLIRGHETRRQRAEGLLGWDPGRDMEGGTPGFPCSGAPTPTPPPRDRHPGLSRRPWGWPAHSSREMRAPSPGLSPFRAGRSHENLGKNKFAYKVLQSRSTKSSRSSHYHPGVSISQRMK